MRKVGDNIKTYRERAKLSVRELARKIRVGSATIEKYESGEQTPDLETILKLSTVLDVPASELLENTSQSACGNDIELQALIKEIGINRSKLILRKAKDLSEEEFLNIMQSIYEKKYKV
ncbi:MULTISPECIES: helix-turn-helix domain-containing protein [Bacillus]|uniref:helix-turn-helix domain-containing protein n=1 Tax=Bacillus TaxID=1386 RepID=UPI000BB87176|nr:MULTISPECIES: helix-turn-helix transcriptional regulator [Bacillus]